jgi:hypothetical protein
MSNIAPLVPRDHMHAVADVVSETAAPRYRTSKRQARQEELELRLLELQVEDYQHSVAHHRRSDNISLILTVACPAAAFVFLLLLGFGIISLPVALAGGGVTSMISLVRSLLRALRNTPRSLESGVG